MSMNRFLLTFLSVAILLTMVLVACAPAAPAKPATPPATTTKPVVTPPAAITPPVAPQPAPPVPPTAPVAPAAPIKTSYDAKVYTNDQYGCSFLYPSTLISATPKAKYDIFSAADAMGVPAVGVSVLDTGKVAEQSNENLVGVGGSDMKEVSSENVTLADGKTKGLFTQLSWKSSGYSITTYSLAYEKGDKTVSVSYTSLTDMIDAKLAKEVVYTLTLK
jgi:hypothetical protein